MSAKKSANVSIYQIKITLRDSKPPIWRRIQVRSDATLGDMHHIIQEVMGWWDYHLHQFIVGETYYGPLHPGYDDFIDFDENEVQLSQIVAGEKFSFVYEYDFGDSWEHILLVEKVLPVEPDQRYPICLKGKRACPHEDVGGIWGYDTFLEAIQDPEHPEHEEYLEWAGGEFDPEAFDLDAVNAALLDL
ncbi:MAG: plasmid pRiA4b ORF-3 family protein [Chloroflexota bacterium]|nr:plasmid pRiA4b ORF-3 family protein [Chloroflexota bacterium]